MKPCLRKNCFLLFLSLSSFFLFVSCWDTDENKKGDAKKTEQSQGGAQAAPSVEDLLKRIKELESDNKQLKEKIERDRFRIQEIEKESDHLKSLQNLNKELSQQVETLNQELKTVRAASEAKKQEKPVVDTPKYKKGSCVRWYGGLYEGKKMMRGKISLIKGNIYLVACTDSDAPYLFATGELYEIPESDLSPCD